MGLAKETLKTNTCVLVIYYIVDNCVNASLYNIHNDAVI